MDGNRPLHAGALTHAPSKANVRFRSDVPKKLTERQWSSLSYTLYNMVSTTTANRGAFNANLQEYQDAYDMIINDNGWPYVGASHIRLPYSASQLENLKARILGSLMSHGRLFLVTGNTPEAASNAPKVEDWLNAKLRRRRADGKSEFEKYDELTQFALRDGTGILELLWTQERYRKEVTTQSPVLDPITNQPVMGPDGKPQMEPITNLIDDLRRDYTQYTVVPLKEFYLCPNEARSIGDAAAVMRVEWLMEAELDRRAYGGLFDTSECERALSYLPYGITGVASDPLGTYDKSASHQIGIGAGQGSMVSEFFKNRGPLKVWRIHSNQFDLDGDGIVEENVFWLSDINQRLLGYMPYDYVSGIRPFFACTPFPRPGEFYGFSLLERLAGVQSSLDANKNARNNLQQIGLAPPIAVPTGSKLLQKGGAGAWRLNEYIECDFAQNGEPMIKAIVPAQVPMVSFQEEAVDKAYGNEYTGQDQMALGGQTSGRRAAAEIQKRALTAEVRSALITNQLRSTIEQAINFDRLLILQYMQRPEAYIKSSTNGPELVSVPPEILQLDYTVSIAGSSDPIDSTTRKNEFMSLFQLVMGMPFIQGNPMLQWKWLRTLCEQWGLKNIQELIGTPEDVQNFMNQQAQQAKEQQMMQMLHGGKSGGKK